MITNIIDAHLDENCYTWLITGVAGFIGSNLLEKLLQSGQKVIGLDNFSTGKKSNLQEVEAIVGPVKWNNFLFYQGDICDLSICLEASKDVDFILHQAALGSVPRSIEDPIKTNSANIDGFLNLLFASKENKVKRFVFAASSSTYGDHPDLPKIEENIGRPLSPYAVTKYVNELYADVFNRTYGIDYIGLRYFNIFGKRQDPDGAYAAVIPKWISAIHYHKEVFINGDGTTSRDFCYIENAIQINLLSALSTNKNALNRIYNVAYGERNSLNTLFSLISQNISKKIPSFLASSPTFKSFRPGDVKHSLADITKAKSLLGYSPLFDIHKGLEETIQWYLKNLQK